MFSETIYEHLKSIYETPVSSLISPGSIIDPTYTVSQVINEITNNDVYDVFCMKGKAVFTTNIRELLAGKDITDMPIDPFLYPIPPVSKTDTVQRAANILSHHRIRAVPVVENDAIVGVVTGKRILELLATKDNKWINAGLIFTANPITIPSNETLSAARRLMLSKKIDHLPVIEKNMVKQVLTSYHVLQTLNPHEKLGRRSRGARKVGQLEAKIKNIGSTRIPQCSPQDDLNKIISMILETNTTCCLVILWEKLHGIITYRDILSLLAVKYESEIPLYIVGLPEDQRNVDLIVSKFSSTLKRIQKVYSDIQEAKITVKERRSGSKNKGEGKFDVSATVITPHYAPFIFKESGFDLSQVFEKIGQHMRRKLSKRAKRRYKTSIRKMNLPISPV